MSFCLRDNERARRAASPVRSYFGECTRRSDQGISPGWVDVYSADLERQYLSLPGDTPRGTLCPAPVTHPDYCGTPRSASASCIDCTAYAARHRWSSGWIQFALSVCSFRQ